MKRIPWEALMEAGAVLVISAGGRGVVVSERVRRLLAEGERVEPQEPAA